MVDRAGPSPESNKTTHSLTHRQPAEAATSGGAAAVISRRRVSLSQLITNTRLTAREGSCLCCWTSALHSLHALRGMALCAGAETPLLFLFPEAPPGAARTMSPSFEAT